MLKMGEGEGEGEDGNWRKIGMGQGQEQEIIWKWTAAARTRASRAATTITSTLIHTLDADMSPGLNLGKLACVTLLAGLLFTSSVVAQTPVPIHVLTSDLRIDYSDNWVLTPGNMSHISSTFGTTATLSFVGTSITFRSTRSVRQGIEQITLDGVNYQADCSYPNNSVYINTVNIWEMDNLTATEHTVVFTKVTSFNQSVAVVVDFFYTPAPVALSDGPLSASTNSSDPAAAAGSANSALTSTTGTHHSSTAVGAGVGVAIGALILFCAALASWLFVRRRRKIRATSQLLNKQQQQDHRDNYTSSPYSPSPVPVFMGETNITRTSPIRNLRVGDGDGDLRGSGASSIIQPWALTPAQSYAARALSESGATHGTESIAHTSDDVGTINSAQDGRRPPTYVSSRPRANPSGSQMGNLAVFLEDPATSLRGDLEK